MTGTRDQKILDFLKEVGCQLGSTVSKNTFAVIAKNIEDDTGKLVEARKIGIPIYDCNMFLEKYST